MHKYKFKASVEIYEYLSEKCHIRLFISNSCSVDDRDSRSATANECDCLSVTVMT